MAEPHYSPQRRKAWWFTVVAALTAVLALVAPSAPVGVAQPGDPIEIAPANVEQSVAQISTTVDYQGVIGAGAGIVLTPDGVVLTNNHVVSGADSITAATSSGQSFQARLLGYDRTNDIALIQLLGANGLPTAPIGDSSQVAAGDPVVSLGNADGMGSPVSREEGTVEALGQDIVAEDEVTGSSEQLTDLIGIAALVRPGDSGGPLVNSAGQVIGVTVAASVNYRVGPLGKGFAIPINRAMGIANQIQSRMPSDTVHIGPPAMLGIGVRTTQERDFGVEIRDVLPGTPAEQAGLRRGDVLVSLAGVPLENPTTLTNVLDRHYPGQVVDLTWLGPNGREFTAKVTLAPGPDGG